MLENPEIIKDSLKKIRQIEIRTRRLLDSHFIGSYKSVFKGQGIDFEEIREYIPGDDIRSIDWNVTAKTEKLYVKQFREDRERVMMIAVDVSSSLDFGSVNVSKREILTEISSILAFSAIKNNDKVGLLLFSDKIERFVPPNKGKKHVLRILREILFTRPTSRGTNLVNACENLQRLLKKRSIIFFLSDFIFGMKESSKEFYKQIGMLNRRHELIGIHIEDPIEQTFANVGWINLEDSETGEHVFINSNACLKTFQNLQKKSSETRHHEFKKFGIDFLTLSAKDDYIVQLERYFVNKK